MTIRYRILIDFRYKYVQHARPFLKSARKSLLPDLCRALLAHYLPAPVRQRSSRGPTRRLRCKLLKLRGCWRGC